ATTASCDCPDAVQRQVVCKHSLALTILSAVSAIQSRERAEACASARPRGWADDALDLDPGAPIPFELTPKAIAALAALSVTTDPTSPQTAAQGQQGHILYMGAVELCGPLGAGRALYDEFVRPEGQIIDPSGPLASYSQVHPMGGHGKETEHVAGHDGEGDRAGEHGRGLPGAAPGEPGERAGGLRPDRGRAGGGAHQRLGSGVGHRC